MLRYWLCYKDKSFNINNIKPVDAAIEDVISFVVDKRSLVGFGSIVEGKSVSKVLSLEEYDLVTKRYWLCYNLT